MFFFDPQMRSTASMSLQTKESKTWKNTNYKTNQGHKFHMSFAFGLFWFSQLAFSTAQRILQDAYMVNVAYI